MKSEMHMLSDVYLWRYLNEPPLFIIPRGGFQFPHRRHARSLIRCAIDGVNVPNVAGDAFEMSRFISPVDMKDLEAFMIKSVQASQNGVVQRTRIDATRRAKVMLERNIVGRGDGLGEWP